MVGAAAFFIVDICDQLVLEGPRLAGLAFGLVALILWVSHRFRISHTLLALLPVTLGALWTVALMRVLSLDLDMFNIAGLLILVGLGVDDGVHMLHRFRRYARDATRDRPVLDAWLDTGSPVLLTSLTTGVGFGSFLLTGHVGLASLGGLVVLGIVCNTAAALLVMPAACVLLRALPRASAT